MIFDEISNGAHGFLIGPRVYNGQPATKPKSEKVFFSIVSKTIGRTAIKCVPSFYLIFYDFSSSCFLMKLEIVLYFLIQNGLKLLLNL